MTSPDTASPSRPRRVLWVVVALSLAAVAIGIATFYVQGGTTSFLALTELTGGQTLNYGSYPSLANADYFARVKGEFIAGKKDFVDVDLSAMTARVYKGGEVAVEVPILTKGREGSWWETPAGLYRIESREESHFSSIGHVYQPWSMAFQGNFFIHGWPYYPDGTPVSSQFSGGCIRLADEDAKAIYDLVSVGTPVLVYEKDFGNDGFSYKPQRPAVTADAYLAADLGNNYVLTELDSGKALPVASVTKLVTALVAAEHINLDKQIPVPQTAIIPTSRPRLAAGTEIQAFQLLYPLLLESSNEAAEVLARSSGRDRFVSLMNRKAEALGMSSTRFADPAGRDPGNVSSAEDLYSLLKYIHNNRSFIFKISTGKLNDSAYGAPIYTDLGNFNSFPVSGASFVGGKTGKTEAAQETAVAVYTINLQGEDRTIAFVLLGSENVHTDMAALVEFVTQSHR